MKTGEVFESLYEKPLEGQGHPYTMCPEIAAPCLGETLYYL